MFDVGVIGGGPAGLAVASGLRRGGKSVAIVEKYLWGGTCPNYGCDPKKILVSAADVVRASRLAVSELTGSVVLDWPAVMAKKNAYTKGIPYGSRRGQEKAGNAVYDGEARFINATTVELTRPDGSVEAVTAGKWVIATGERPASLDFPGNELAETSEDFLSMAEMPGDITFVGAGYIGVEFANLSALAGARVHLVHHSARPLRAFDGELVAALMADFGRRGIDVRLESSVAAATRGADGRLSLTLADGETLATDRLFVTAGRLPNSDGLGLDAIGVRADRHGVAVDDYLATAVPTIYAIGDVAATRAGKLTPVAGYQARYLVRQLLGTEDAAISYPVIPTVVFASPRIAQVGVTADEAVSRGLAVSELTLSHWFNYMRRNDAARARVVLDGGRIVGVSLLSEEADEIINIFVNAINAGWTLADVQARIYAYPSLSSDLQYFY